MSGHTIFDFCNRISAQKRKSSRNRFSLFMAGAQVEFSEQTDRGNKSRDNVPLRASTMYTIFMLRRHGVEGGGG